MANGINNTRDNDRTTESKYRDSVRRNLKNQELEEQKELIKQEEKLRYDSYKRINKLKSKLDDKTTKDSDKKNLKKRIKQEEEYLKQASKLAEKQREAERKKIELEEKKEYAKNLRDSGGVRNRIQGQRMYDKAVKEEKKVADKAVRDSMTTGDKISQVLDKFNTVAKALDAQIDEIAGYQSKWNSRLKGSSYDYKGLSNTITTAIGASPYVSLKSVYSNIDSLVEKGIAFNVEQRAFLQSVKDDIASTFDAANGTLLQLVRIQQTDTTASRLGMEAYLTETLNGLYKNTQYLTDEFDNVTSALYDTTALLSGKGGVEFEYQVQKWLGSMYSTGVGSAFINNLATALGQLGSGNISGMSEQMMTLLAMASSRGGSSLSELLTGGLNATTTNTLLSNVVSYLGTLYGNGNNVVTSQFANLFGLTTSDLKALSGLAKDSGVLSNSSLSYASSINYLGKRVSELGSIMSQGELLGNLWENTQYGIAQGIASNSVMYGLWKVTDALDSIMGGIAIPAVSVLGNMVDLENNMAALMRTGLLGTSLMSNIGSLASGAVGDSLSLLSKMGIGTNIVSLDRGTLNALSIGGYSSSGVSVVSNTSGDDIYSSIAANAEEQKLSLLDTEDSKDVNDVYDLMKQVIDGEYDIRTKIVGINTIDALHVICDNPESFSQYLGG